MPAGARQPPRQARKEACFYGGSEISGLDCRPPNGRRRPPGRSFATDPADEASIQLPGCNFSGYFRVVSVGARGNNCVVITIRSVSHAGVALVLAASMIALGACGEGAGSTPPGQAAAAPLLLSPEDLVTLSESPLASGPLITGSVEAERRADLRAEVPAVVLAVLKENGDPVRRGDLLVRLDQTAIRDALTSAEASARAAELAYEQAEQIGRAHV